MPSYGFGMGVGLPAPGPRSSKTFAIVPMELRFNGRQYHP